MRIPPFDRCFFSGGVPVDLSPGDGDVTGRDVTWGLLGVIYRRCVFILQTGWDGIVQCSVV